MSKGLTIRSMLPSDWEDIRLIYTQGIEDQIATFEKSCPPSFEEFSRNHIHCASHVAEAAGSSRPEIVGYIVAVPTSSRECYRGVIFESVYVRRDWRGRGVGKLLLQRLIEESEQHGFWTLEAWIFVKNIHSITLHEKVGFKKIGIREKIGNYGGEWRDVLMMERRSEKVGFD